VRVVVVVRVVPRSPFVGGFSSNAHHRDGQGLLPGIGHTADGHHHELVVRRPGGTENRIRGAAHGRERQRPDWTPADYHVIPPLPLVEDCGAIRWTTVRVAVTALVIHRQTQEAELFARVAAPPPSHVVVFQPQRLGRYR